MSRSHSGRRYLVSACVLLSLIAGYVLLTYRFQRLPAIPKPADSRAQWGLPIIPVTTPSGEIIAVEVAWTDKQKAKGLMFREKLPPGTGMLFVNENEGYQEMWMKNTWIPLDIIFIDGDGVVTSIASQVPPSEPNRSTEQPAVRWGYAKYVLEIRAGDSRRLKIEKGIQLQFDWKHKQRRRNG